MARADAGGMHSTSHTNIPKKIDAGEYNKITFVDSSTTVAFTGSNAAAGFICEVVTNVVIEAVNGGTIPGTALTADTLYPITPQKVTIGSSGKVYVLHK
tara:strand:+ start:622 stop:918 length:297 start_codon:yes stop_codon:yes gene_type:complete